MIRYLTCRSNILLGNKRCMKCSITRETRDLRRGPRTFKNKKTSLFGISYCKIPPVTSETAVIKIYLEMDFRMNEAEGRSVFWHHSLLLQEIIFFLLFFYLLFSVVSQLTMELGTIPDLSYVLELLRYKWQILSFVRCQNFEMKEWKSDKNWAKIVMDWRG